MPLTGANEWYLMWESDSLQLNKRLSLPLQSVLADGDSSRWKDSISWWMNTAPCRKVLGLRVHLQCKWRCDGHAGRHPHASCSLASVGNNSSEDIVTQASAWASCHSASLLGMNLGDYPLLNSVPLLLLPTLARQKLAGVYPAHAPITPSLCRVDVPVNRHHGTDSDLITLIWI